MSKIFTQIFAPAAPFPHNTLKTKKTTHQAQKLLDMNRLGSIPHHQGEQPHPTVRGDTMKGLITRWIAALCLPLLVAAPAGAGVIGPLTVGDLTTSPPQTLSPVYGPDVSMDLSVGGSPAYSAAIPTYTYGTPSQHSTYTSSNTLISTLPTPFEIIFTVCPDPFITSSLTITNNSAGTQTFSLLSILPVSPSIPTPTRMNGSVSGTVTDNNSDGATLSTDGTHPLYQGWIDTGVVTGTALYPDAWSWPAGPTSFSDSFSNLAGPAVTSNIGIALNFTLTAGDSVTIDSRFEVLPVPEPASLGLVGLALVGLAAARRRA